MKDVDVEGPIGRNYGRDKPPRFIEPQIGSHQTWGHGGVMRVPLSGIPDITRAESSDTRLLNLRIY